MTRIEASTLSELPEILGAQGKRRVLLLTGENRRYVDRALPLLGAFECAVYSGARRHVPQAVVEAAERALDAAGADAIVALGGGSAIGLGKALRLRHDPYFVAIPTTYAGSEQTTLYGTTQGRIKSTGRDPKVRPDAVIYDVELTLDMPLVLSVTSLTNALAHPISVLGAGGVDGELRERALSAIEVVFRALQRLTRNPGDALGRRDALRGAGLAAQVLDSGKPGLHHALAHRLGGRFDVDHGGLHSVLLPHSLHQLRADTPELVGTIERRLGVDDLEARLFDLLTGAGASTSLAALGVGEAAFAEFIRAEPALPAALLNAAFLGTRPTARAR
jgi:maleylacetate reductase